MSPATVRTTANAAIPASVYAPAFAMNRITPTPLSEAPLRRAARFLGLGRSMVGLLGMVILVGMGERMAERFLPIYLIALGGSAIAVGLLNGLTNLLNALYSFPGGYLAEKLGIKRSLLVFNLIAMVGYLIVILFPAWQAVIVGSVFFLSWSAVSLPATMGLVARALPKDKRTMGVSMHSLVRRIPMAIGPVLGGLMIVRWGERDGVRFAFIAALALAVVAMVLQQRLIEEQGPHPHRAEENPLRLWGQLSKDLKSLLVSDILIRFCEQIPYAFVVLWAMKVVAQPVTAFQFGVLTAIEMTTAALIYVPVAYFADRGEKKPFVVLTFVFFTLFPLVLFFTRSFGWLVLAFVLRGLKEFGEPTRKALIMDLAPAEHKAGAFGLYYLVRDVVVSVAAFGGAFLWQVSPAANFFGAFACGVVGTLWFLVRGKSVSAGAAR
jgi:MFS family permease